MEAPISCTFGGVVFSIPGRLEDLLHHGYVLPKGAEDEIRLIKRDLEDVVVILHGQRNNNLEEHAMVVWTKEVRELSYDMEDFIDQYELAAADSQRFSNRRIHRCKIFHWRRSKKAPWTSSNLRQRLWMANKIREFSMRVQEVLQRYSVYNLGLANGASSASHASFRPWHPRPSGNEAYPPLVGISSAMNKLEEWLLGMQGAEQQKLRVVSIVGFGGIGKTTLANELYHKIGQQFECRAFIRMSRKPDMRRIFISMLSQVHPHLPPDNWKLQNLISSVRAHLQDKRYLIIVDDLWAASTWDIVKYALPEGNNGSRIITTTEIEELALQSCSYDPKYVFKMEPLGENDSRELFFSTVFGSPYECPEKLREVSCHIIQKCGGLPLAIVIISSMLASKLDTKEHWDYLNNSLGYILMRNPNWERMKQVLDLCYNNLPHNLKACMLYMSIYPEGNIILKDDLVNQWIAEGFICATEGHDRQEIARAWFNELVGQNLVQPVHINDNGEVLSCVVHQMVLRFITTYKSIEQNFVTVIHHSETTVTLADKVRRLSLNFGNEEDATPPKNMRLSQVRTLAFFGIFKCMPSIVEFRLLQVLILHFWGDESIISLDLTRISELFRLRYLMVASNVTLELRTRMCGLKYLETLKIDARISLVPSDIVHLPALLHLSLPAEANLPNGISNMTSLRTLGYFDLSCNSTQNVQSLGNLMNLQDLEVTCSTTPEPCNLKSKIQFLLRSTLEKLCNLKSLALAPKSSRNSNYLDDAGATSIIISSDDFTYSSTPPTLLSRLELSPRICIFGDLPKCIRQLHKLCILKIGVRKIIGDGVEILAGLPNLTVLSLFIHTKPTARIVIGKTGFSVLQCFKFKCSAPSLDFETDAMPQLKRLKLCFNAHITDEQRSVPVGIEHLSGIKEVCLKIGGARPEQTYRIEVALKEAMKSSVGKTSCPRVNVECSRRVFGFMEDRSGVKGDEESENPKQDEILEEATVEDEHTMEEGSPILISWENDLPRNSGEHDVSFHSGLISESTGESGITQQSQVDDVDEFWRHLAARATQNDPSCIAGHCHGIVGDLLPQCRSESDQQEAGGTGMTNPVLLTRTWGLLDPASSHTLAEELVAPAHKKQRRESGERQTVMVPVQRAGGNTDEPPNDGYTWRKYGQKDILGSRFPRSYYRCTHRNCYGCEAKKKVQRLDNDPFMYEVTYCGNHTCLTSTTPLLTLPPTATTDTVVTTNSPTSSAAILAQELAMVSAEHHPPPAPSISLVGARSSAAGAAGEGSSAQGNVATSRDWEGHRVPGG